MRVALRVNRLWAQNMVLACAWPFVALLVQVKNYPRWGLWSGFIAFCVYAGWTFSPMEGTDAHTFAQRLLTHGPDAHLAVREPFSSGMFWVLGHLGLGTRWYFAIIGLAYAIVVTWSARLLLAGRLQWTWKYLPAALFIAAWLLYQPVFSALNARYWFGLWFMLLSTILALNNRWLLAALIAGFGFGIHFGHVIFGIALALLFLSRYLKGFQLPFAYGLLVAAWFVPGNWLLEWSAAVNPAEGTAFGEQVSFYAELPERRAAAVASGRERPTTAWFLRWYRAPLFFALLVSGHALVVRKWWRDRRSGGYTLWALVILLLAFQVALRAEVSSASRVQSSLMAIMLLWHAGWFLERRDGAAMALTLTVPALVFFFVVHYRRVLTQANMATFFPLPFGIVPDLWPTVMELLGFG